MASLRQARDDWLRRLETAQKSESAVVAYRVAIDDLLDWSEANRRTAFDETAVVDYLTWYQQRAQPAPATYLPSLPSPAPVPPVGEPTRRCSRSLPRSRPASEAAAGARLADP